MLVKMEVSWFMKYHFTAYFSTLFCWILVLKWLMYSLINKNSFQSCIIVIKSFWWYLLFIIHLFIYFIFYLHQKTIFVIRGWLRLQLITVYHVLAPRIWASKLIRVIKKNSWNKNQWSHPWHIATTSIVIKTNKKSG